MPTIHVKDLARMVKKITETKPEINYIMGIDKTVNGTQKSIIEAISSEMGTGEIESIAVPNESEPFVIQKLTPYNGLTLQLNSWKALLRIDLKIKVSSIMINVDEEGNEEDVEFEWYCKDGMKNSIQKVAQEYCKSMNLKPVKILLNGPPISGKTYFSKK